MDTQHRITREKARHADNAHRPSPVVIACDTTVLLDGDMLNKPADPDEARSMLSALRGREHEVQSCVVVRENERERVEIASSRVRMRDYSDEEIAVYVASGDPFDKAGGYAVQHAEFSPVAEIFGCPLNVMGLPLCTLREMLPRMPDPSRVCAALSAQLPSVRARPCEATIRR